MEIKLRTRSARLIADLSPLLLLVPFYIRSSTALSRVFEKTLIFADSDSFYHARRIFDCIANYPKLITFDADLFFPHGLSIPWPPLYDLFVATLLLPWTLIYSNELDLEMIASFINPMLGTIVVTFVLAAGYFYGNMRVAIIAAIFCTLSASQVHASSYANLDHHVFEPLFVTLLLLVFFEFQQGRTTLKLFLMGFLLGVCSGFAPIIWLLTMCFCTFLMFCEWRGDSTLPLSLGILVGALPIFLLCSSTAHFKLLNVHSFSLFYLYLYALPVLTSLSKKVLPSSSKAAPLASLLFLVLPLLNENVLTALKQVYEFLTASNAIALLWESRPSWQSDHFLNGFFGVSFLLSPLAIAGVWIAAIRDRLSNTTLFIAFLTSLLGVLAWNQERFVLVFEPLLFLFWAKTIDLVLDRFFGPRLLKTVILFVFVLVFFNHWPAVKHYTYDPATKVSSNDEAATLMFNWLREHTDQSGSTENNAPNFGILTDWSLGTKVLYRSQRATFAHPFITDASTPGLVPSLRFAYLWKEEEAFNFMNQNQLEYVVLSQNLENLTRDLETLEQNIGDYLETSDEKSQIPEKLSESLLIKLGFIFNRTLPGTHHLRFSYESHIQANVFGVADSHYKVYRRVAGCLVKGKIEPNTAFTIEIQLVSPAGRIAVAAWPVRSNDQGDFEVRLPYDLREAERYSVRVGSPYIIKKIPGEIQLFKIEPDCVDRGGIAFVEIDKLPTYPYTAP